MAEVRNCEKLLLRGQLRSSVAMKRIQTSVTKIFTIGHSTRSFDELVAMLRGSGVEQLIDVRTVPRSRHNPQYSRDVLSKALHNRRIGYRHLKSLGGLRRARPDSINSG